MIYCTDFNFKLSGNRTEYTELGIAIVTLSDCPVSVPNCIENKNVKFGR